MLPSLSRVLRARIGAVNRRNITAARTPQTAIRTSSQISGRPLPPLREAPRWAGARRDGAVGADVVGVDGDVVGVDAGVVGVDAGVVGADVDVLGAGAVVVGSGDVAVGDSGKAWVSVGGTCPVPVAPRAGDVKTLTAASRTQTATPVAQHADGRPVQFAVALCHTFQNNPPGDAAIRTHRRGP
jgi:hypothetical protein